MPKVLRIINRFNLGGPTYNVAYLSKYMAPEFETLLIGGQWGESEGASDFIVKNLGLEPIIIPEMRREINPKNDYIAYKKIKAIIKEFKPDVVHTHASKAGTLGRLAARKMNVPVIVHTFHGHIFHSYFNKYKTSFLKNIERKLAKKSSQIIAISEIQKKELCYIHKIAPKDKFSVIPLGFDLERFQEDSETKRIDFRNTYKIEDDVIAIGIVGRLVDVKNHRMFINAIAKVKAQTSRKIRVFIIGDGELKTDIINQCQSLNLTTSNADVKELNVDIVFTSWINNIDWAYAGVDIACLTSKNEGTPVSLIEAQAANTPIVSTNVGGIENVVIENETALLAENENTEDFTDKLLKVIENDDLRTKMQIAGWKFVKDKFHYNRLVRDIKELYHNLLTK